MNHRGALMLGQNCGSVGHVFTRDSYRILIWLEERPYPRLSSDVRLSRRNGNPIDHGIPFDIAIFVLCSTRNLREAKTSKRGWRGESGVSRRPALTFWVVRVHANDAFFVACDEGKLLVREEKVGRSYTDLLGVLRQNDEFIRIFLRRTSSVRTSFESSRMKG